jgi:hypothetical protein
LLFNSFKPNFILTLLNLSLKKASNNKINQMKKIVFLAATTILGSALLFTSCRKKEVEDNDTEGVKDHAMAETHSNDITNIGSQASYGQATYTANGTYKSSQPDQVYTACAVITFDTLSGIKDTMKVDFGSGCVGGDSRTRKGLLCFVHNHGMHYRDSGNVISVSTPGNTYFVDGNQVIINSKTIANKGHVTGGQLTWDIAANLTINKASGGTISWTTNKTKVLMAGERPSPQPIDWKNAKVAVYGSASGTTAKNENFTVNVSQANKLVRDFTCSTARRFFVAGILEFTPGTKPTRYINFGTGNCDDQAVVTINGHTYNVTLH